MGEVFLNFISVLWPILASVGFLIIAFLPKKALHESIRVSVSITLFKFSPEPHLSIWLQGLCLRSLRFSFFCFRLFAIIHDSFRSTSRLMHISTTTELRTR